MGYRVCSSLRGAVDYSLSGPVLKGHGTLFKAQCFMRSCCVQTKQSSLIYHVEIVAQDIKGVSCRAEEGFIYCISWGRWPKGLYWPNRVFSPHNPQGHAEEVRYWQTRPEGSEWKLSSNTGPRSYDHRVQPSLWGTRTCSWDNARISSLDAISTGFLCVYLLWILPHAFIHTLDPSWDGYSVA